MTGGVINMGAGTHSIPVSLFHENRHRVCAELRKNGAGNAGTFILLQGGDTLGFYDTDTDYVFRQVMYHCLFVTQKICSRKKLF